MDPAGRVFLKSKFEFGFMTENLAIAERAPGKALARSISGTILAQ